MFEAIVTGLIAAVAVVIIVAVGIALWNNRKTPKAGQVKAVKQLDTVGVGTSPFERHSAALSNKSGEVRVRVEAAAVCGGAAGRAGDFPAGDAKRRQAAR